TGPTCGAVTAGDTPPTGLSIANLSGTGWTCTVTLVNCKRRDALDAGQSLPTSPVTVNSATNAPATITNNVSISGGGSTGSTGSRSDERRVGHTRTLRMTQTHTGSFTQGQTGAQLTVTASKTGPGPTSGTVPAADTATTPL